MPQSLDKLNAKLEKKGLHAEPFNHADTRRLEGFNAPERGWRYYVADMHGFIISNHASLDDAAHKHLI